IDRRLQISSEIDELPFNLLSGILLLFEDKHVMVEELLQLLVGVIDAQLLEAVVFEDFETSNIQNADEAFRIRTRTSVVELFVDHFHQLAKATFIQTLR